jgi:hypothetical protein
VQARNRPIFSKADDIDPTPKNLAARQTTASFTDGGPVTFSGANADAVAEGCYVIISADPGGSGRPEGYMNGRIYRVGVRDETNANQYDLIPGSEFLTDPGPDGDFSTNGDNITALNNVPVLIVGKGFVGSEPEGTAMDVSVYTTYIKVN